MTKEFIPYEQALELKELGFDESCFGSYVKLTDTQNTFFMNDVVSEIDRETPLHKSLITKAPLYQQAFRWFREKYNLYAAIYPIKQHWECDVRHTNKDVNSSMFTWDNNFTYEEAELECLKKLIEIVKQK